MASAKPIDIFDIDTTEASNKGAEIEIVHPVTKKGMGVFISVLGKDSDVFREYMKENVDDRIRKEAMASRRNKQVDPQTSEDIERNSIEMLALCISESGKPWRSETKNEDKSVTSEDVIYMQGERLEFTPKNIIKVLTKSLPIRRQVDEAIGDLGNFIKD